MQKLPGEGGWLRTAFIVRLEANVLSYLMVYATGMGRELLYPGSVP